MKKISFLIVICLIPLAGLSQSDGNSTESIESVVINYEYNREIPDFFESTLIQSNQYLSEKRDIDYSFPRSAGASFFSSLIIPGSGQLVNKKWWRAGLFLALEATGIYLAADARNKALKGERRYEQFADNNWSVVEYSNWLITYHEVNGIENPFIDDLRDLIGDAEASFDTQVDWNVVDISLLRQVERNTPYLTTDNFNANNFSHTLPNYGSQQYYELISKYFQYQGGWKDYNRFHDNIDNTGSSFNNRYLVDRNGAHASPDFFEAASIANQFNTNYRNSRLYTSLLIANHFISAFDTYFTIKLKQNRLQASSSVVPGQQVILSYKF